MLKHRKEKHPSSTMCPLPSTNSKETQEETGNKEAVPITITKYVIFKNLVAISMGSLLILSTADVMEVYQSTLNVEGGVGVASVAVQFFSSFIAALFLPKYLIKRFGSKAVIVLAMSAFIPFVVVNYYPLYPLMILSSVFIGMGITLFMGAIDPYVNDLATYYSQLVAKENDTKEPTQSNDISRENAVSYLNYQTLDKVEIEQDQMFDFSENSIANKAHVDTIQFGTSLSETKLKKRYSESTTSRFFGLYAMLYQTSFIWGSLMSFYVLQNGYSETQNFAIMNDTCTCGAGYCVDKTVCLEQNLMQPSPETRNILISICLGLCIVAGVVVIVFFNDLKPKDKNVSLSLQVLLATFRQTQKRNHLLLIPLTMHNGMIKAFYLTDFTKLLIFFSYGLEYKFT